MRTLSPLSFSALSSFFDARPASFARERGDNTTEQATAAQNKTRSAPVAEVLRARGDFVHKHGTLSRHLRVTTKRNVMADALSRPGGFERFEAEARRLGASRVRDESFSMITRTGAHHMCTCLSLMPRCSSSAL